MFIKDCKKKSNEYFDNILEKRTYLMTVWDASKAVMRYFIQYNHSEKKESQEKIEKIINEIRNKDIELQKSPMDSKILHQIKLLYYINRNRN